MNFKTIKYLLPSILLASVCTLSAQKKVLDETVYDSWKILKNPQVTNDGKYAVNIVAPQEGDAVVLIHNLKNGKSHKIERSEKYEITPDQKYVLAQVKATFADLRQAKIKKTADEKVPKDSLVIFNLDKQSETKIPNIRSFKQGKDDGRYIAYALSDSTKGKGEFAERAYTLVIRNLNSGKEDSLKFISQYEFSRNGKSLAAVVKPNDKDSVYRSQVIFVNLEKNTKTAVSTGQKEYKSISLSDDGQKLAFLGTADSSKVEVKEFKLFYYNIAGMDSARIVAEESSSTMKKGWNVSQNQNPTFSRNSERLLFGVAPKALPKDTTIPDFEKAQLDIWHWEEPQIQPMQLVQLSRKQKESFLSYIDLKNPMTFYQLGSEEIPMVTIPDEGNARYAIGRSNREYEFEAQWDIPSRSTNDVWLFDLSNNTSRQIKTKLQGPMYFSPNGTYLAWYDLFTRQYYSYSFADGSERCLTDKLNVNLWTEDHDEPGVPYPYGVGAWKEGDKALWVYDRFDIWELDPSGAIAPINITQNKGRTDSLTFRYLKPYPDSRFIEAKEKPLFSMFNNASKDAGYYTLNKGVLTQLTKGNYVYSMTTRAKDKDVYIYTKENFQNCRDLYFTTNEWKTETRLTDINPQQKEYNWGTVERVEWTTFSGKPAEGLLYKPENFDPNKKYPVMTYFYDRQIDELNRYYSPAPSASIINIPYFCSRGYLVFVPDTYYTAGHPGKSAYDYIVSGVENLSKNSWVDKDNVGVQGQSWGGYQVAYLITQTNIFKAAGAGAPVSNMFSAYGGIRWATGNSRQYQYEQTQSRIGKTIWEAPDLYTENSPVLFADKVETPLLIMHNDKDGAVPWYQGIEYFMALRRLGKPVWLLQYNGEEHNLMQRRNRKDLSMRLQQFFDHYLKGAPMPVWLKTGVPAISKGKTYGFEVAE